ncbi:MAG: hypothetical protein K9N38_12360 [Candidatus Marinimicrobia bacterium]|nr:hypothetical protein [Candidatus Neomarinimicrobiota bacterium]
MIFANMSPPRTTATKRLPDIWLKAAMLGSLWASVEIILGSFLHNLHVPLSGTFLAALGLILLINGYKLWPQPGLLWRAALITATMKSVSPSAIIFGPMVGIFMEGLILELMVRLFRGRWPGFIIGGAIAVSWSLFQKIFVLLLTFGPDFVQLYEQLYLMAAKSLQISESVPFDLVRMIFVIDLFFGGLVALFALRTGYQSERLTADQTDHDEAVESSEIFTVSGDQVFSVPLLILNVLLFFSGLLYLDRFTLPVRAGLISLFVLFNIFRYTRSLHRLKRPSLWIQLTAIMTLSGLILGGVGSVDQIRIGLASGMGMALRALFVIFSFSALSIEIRNPLIINWFKQHKRRILFESLSVAFEVLPRMINVVSQKKQRWRHPFRTLNRMLGILEQLRKEHTTATARVILVVGTQGSGKTSRLQTILGSDKLNEFTFQGILTEGVWKAGERDHYHVRDIQTKQSELLCERGGPESSINAGPFNFRRSGLDFGCQALMEIEDVPGSIVIIDEIGHLELRDEGWAGCMETLLLRGRAMIWSVRPALVEAVKSKWALAFETHVVEEENLDDLLEKIRVHLR